MKEVEFAEGEPSSADPDQYAAMLFDWFLSSGNLDVLKQHCQRIADDGLQACPSGS